MRQSAQRLNDLGARIQDKVRWVSDETISKAKSFDDETEAAITAQQQAAQDFRAGEALLPGTGEALWKAMLSAAEQYSSVVYPDQIFPHMHDGAQCVLCQQSLEPAAGERLSRFVEYVKKDVAKQASEKFEARAQKRHKIANAALDIGLSASLVDELTGLDPAALLAAQVTEAAIEIRREWLLDRLAQHDWTDLPELPNEAVGLLRKCSDLAIQEATELDKLADPKAKDALLKERDRLASRDKLRPRLQAVLDLVQRMKDKAALIKCKDAIKTKQVSDKAKELARLLCSRLR